jgi:hypothetical protein
LPTPNDAFSAIASAIEGNMRLFTQDYPSRSVELTRQKIAEYLEGAAERALSEKNIDLLRRWQTDWTLQSPQWADYLTRIRDDTEQTGWLDPAIVWAFARLASMPIWVVGETDVDAYVFTPRNLLGLKTAWPPIVLAFVKPWFYFVIRRVPDASSGDGR